MERNIYLINKIYYSLASVLANEHLNLGTWQDNLELIYKKPLHLNSLDFDFMLTPNSLFSIFFNRKANIYYGVRFSKNRDYPSIFFISNAAGKFIYKKNLLLSGLSAKQWHQAKINFSKNQLHLFIDHQLVFSENIPVTSQEKNKKGFFGFRGSPFGVFIDNIYVQEVNSKRHLLENFSPKSKKLPLETLRFFIILFFLFALLTSKAPLTKYFYYYFQFLIIILSFSLVFYFIKLHVSPKNPLDVFKSMPSFKTLVEKKFTKYIRQIIKKHGPVSNKKQRSVLFLGGSQTWGDGASSEKNTFVSLFEKKLNSVSSKNIICINAGYPVVTMTEIETAYLNDLIKLHPAVVIINSAYNNFFFNSLRAGGFPLKNKISNQQLSLFSHQLQHIIDYNQKHHIATILILEPNETVKLQKELHAFNLQVLAVAKKNNIPCLNAHHYMLENYDTGFIWWDVIHFTNYGHQLMAEFIYSHFDLKLLQDNKN